MVSYFAGLCEFCGEPNTLATREQCQQAGIDVEVAACVECVRRMRLVVEDAPVPAETLTN